MFWPLSHESSLQVQESALPTSPGREPATLRWQNALRIHQNNAQTMATHDTSRGVLLVSGGDDGALAFVLVCPDSRPDPDTVSTSAPLPTDGKQVASRTSPLVLLTRAHASAVTACAIFTRGRGEDIYVLTTGNDEWVRLWRVGINIPFSPAAASKDEDRVEGDGEYDAVSVQRLGKCKTSVADVSSMAVLHADGESARVLVCGVGMEVIRVEW